MDAVVLRGWCEPGRAKEGMPKPFLSPIFVFELHIIVITINGVVRLSYHDTDLYCF